MQIVVTDLNAATGIEDKYPEHAAPRMNNEINKE